TPYSYIYSCRLNTSTMILLLYFNMLPLLSIYFLLFRYLPLSHIQYILPPASCIYPPSRYPACLSLSIPYISPYPEAARTGTRCRLCSGLAPESPVSSLVTLKLPPYFPIPHTLSSLPLCP